MPHNYHKNSLQIYHNSPRNKIFSNSSVDTFHLLTQLTSLEQGDCSATEVQISQTAYPCTSDLKHHGKATHLTLSQCNHFLLVFPRGHAKKCVHKNIHFTWLWNTSHTENTTIVVAKCDFLWEY